MAPSFFAALFHVNSGQLKEDEIETERGSDTAETDPVVMEMRANGTEHKMMAPAKRSQSGRTFQTAEPEFRRNSIESLSPCPVDEAPNELKVKKSGIFMHLPWRSRVESATRDKIEAGKTEKNRRELAEKDELIGRLRFQLKQREAAITQLEEIVLLQQESMELSRRSSEVELKRSSRNTSMEEEEMQEVINHLHKQLKERNETNASLSATIKKQQEQLDSMKEKSRAAEDEANKERINEMKGIIQDLQAKLMDKNNTNGALVRSAKMQSETIASLRSELKALRQQEVEANQGSAEELRRKDEIIAQLRQELITISQAFNARSAEFGGDGDSDDEYYGGGGMIGNQVLDVVQEEGSEASVNTR